MLMPGDVIVVEFKALKCLRQGNKDTRVADTAKRYARLVVRRLLEAGEVDAAARVAVKIIQNFLDNNSK